MFLFCISSNICKVFIKFVGCINFMIKLVITCIALTIRDNFCNSFPCLCNVTFIILKCTAIVFSCTFSNESRNLLVQVLISVLEGNVLSVRFYFYFRVSFLSLMGICNSSVILGAHGRLISFVTEGAHASKHLIK